MKAGRTFLSSPRKRGPIAPRLSIGRWLWVPARARVRSLGRDDIGDRGASNAAPTVQAKSAIEPRQRHTCPDPSPLWGGWPSGGESRARPGGARLAAQDAFAWIRRRTPHPVRARIPSARTTLPTRGRDSVLAARLLRTEAHHAPNKGEPMPQSTLTFIDHRTPAQRARYERQQRKDAATWRGICNIM